MTKPKKTIAKKASAKKAKKTIYKVSKTIYGMQMEKGVPDPDPDKLHTRADRNRAENQIAWLKDLIIPEELPNLAKAAQKEITRLEKTLS
jgi:hypothetical protein